MASMCASRRCHAALRTLRGRVEIHWIRKLRPLGHVVAQKSLLPGPVVRSLHPRRVAPKDAVALRHLFGRGNDDDRKLNLVVVKVIVGS